MLSVRYGLLMSHLCFKWDRFVFFKHNQAGVRCSFSMIYTNHLQLLHEKEERFPGQAAAPPANLFTCPPDHERHGPVRGPNMGSTKCQASYVPYLRHGSPVLVG
ncbi:MAG: hypothetical protein D6730_13165, partial [Bacteroidetes bacterium]